MIDGFLFQVNVFNRRSTTNPNKSQLKLFDSKREVSSRLKHLRLISGEFSLIAVDVVISHPSFHRLSSVCLLSATGDWYVLVGKQQRLMFERQKERH